MMSLLGKVKKKRERERYSVSNLQHKRRLRDSYTNKELQGKKMERARDELGSRY